jgi:hypothetical protein
MSKGLKSTGWLATAGIGVAGLALLAACVGDAEDTAAAGDITERLNTYATVRLTTDLSALTENEREMLPLLIEAAQPMTDLFWVQAYGSRDSLLNSLDDPATRQLVGINYGPWDRLAGNEPFLPGVAPKPAGANFYPPDMTKREFEAALDAPAAASEQLRSLYTLVRRSDDGSLGPVPYHERFAEELDGAAVKLREAAVLADDPGLRRYLTMRAEALVTDEYQPSDLSWMDMKDNRLDIVIGAIETYEDQLYGYKAAYEAFVLVKDMAWSERLARFAQYLPDLQRGLPVPETYKREMPGSDGDLNAYDVVFYAGDANAGSKTIAINLPNDEEVQAEKGTRRLQLKNAMRAKFDRILVPIAGELIAEDQRQHITFDAFFENTMFHEVAHGLGINNTVNGQGTVREALKEHASAIEEGKADILGLYMVTWLRDNGYLTEGDLRDNYVTFLAGIFRSVRFGATSAHGRANMVRFHFFQDGGAFTYDAATSTYRVDFDSMRDAMTDLSRLLLTLQGDGDYEGTGQLLAERGVVGPELQAELDRLAEADIPVDIVFEQGMSVLNSN